jgi:hypothetical protein
MARKFFYVCAGMLMLALSYHFGASTAVAQAPSNPVVAVHSGDYSMVTANGDLYWSPDAVHGSAYHLVNNAFSGGPTPALHESWGQVKARYHATPGTMVTPGANDR